MKKIILPRFPEDKQRHYASLVQTYLKVYGDSYISDRDIEVEYHASWNFVKVSIYKWVDAGSGCGTSHHRNLLWDKHIAAMCSVFSIQNMVSSWRWIHHSHKYQYGKKYDVEDNYVPGMTFFIETEPQ